MAWRRATAILDHYERREEELAVADLVETSAAHGLAALGLQRCLWAGTVGAVSCLLVQDEAVAPGVSAITIAGWHAAA